ncbi:TIGR01459 family HAD-type hydrolase [Verminephrobacter eiseniae]|uniref:TIGR01459 family HAD-type hydrolase n=1 Tax=Verminephrobacter eiseniae TaxID=364317 RepID=UPI002238F128|nr:TIGR01459 family HAD-type hydrolase [Verminephrobacter eiseniae]MCW5229835.1 TIGR01459 family HAD-type hydrolase [Verminephrobacter eiseniae]MCW5291566.1 TIGR01459 family HAD-type hydrolase [Verminephrobacter eiseniae]MCW8186157.1 TIGR01459 family HAD-type hydrolase [Verminephrobacter eiseniae]MCW8222897.1 TIGR01459 family HAD-type hydrolase [Verminephrobacter eiseniae]MCW8235367.1 TIGR01459 family HAD-type hydrolase [Verminephrobacter eiseniae]
MTRWAAGLAELAPHFDGFVLDQFGVLHDGQAPYPGVADALRQLRAHAKRVLVLSNSGKRAAYNRQRLAGFGITPGLYDDLISSGELCRQMLARRDRAPWATLGRRVLLLDPGQDRPLIDALALDSVDSVEQADFILLASLADGMQPASLQALLDAAAARRLPLVCANPDRQRLTLHGIAPGSGSVAAHYEQMGGMVVWVGKPYPLIYAACRERLAGLGAERICALGDSIEHDLLGGSRAGLATCFVAGGLHAQDFERAGAAHRAAELQRLLALPAAHGAPAPAWALQRLQWS